MSYREVPVNWLLSLALGLGSALGLKQRVELSDHSINVSLTLPSTDRRAWDTNQYRNGNVFVDGYANPVKPRVNHREQLEDPDTIDVEDGEPDDGPAGETETDTDASGHVSLISSSRYRDYMRQDLVSQLLTPKEQWRLIMYGVIGLGVLMFVNMVLLVYSTGGV